METRQADGAYEALADRTRFLGWLSALPWHRRWFASWPALWAAYSRERAA